MTQPATETSTPPDNREEIRKEALRIEEDCAHSSKGHYNAAAFWKTVNYWIGIPTAILAAIGSGSAFTEHHLWAGGIGLLTAALVAVATFLDPSQKNSSYRSAGDQFLALRNTTRTFRNIELLVTDSDAAQARIIDLGKRRDDLNSGSPQIPNGAFLKARKGIKEGESTHKIDQTYPTKE